MRTLVAGGTVVTPSGSVEMDVLVDGEHIEALLRHEDGVVLDGVHYIDATGRLVIPGGVDVHTHMDTPVGGTQTAAALARASRRDRSARGALTSPRLPTELRPLSRSPPRW